ncbi:hypothetical protein FEZ51_07495 [Pediococcus stilesii]|uniref:Uncharacterized protein n=1 Tax=Pediococcus stilesii TaxID=331679 RepID=A0A5R9BT05_9LACO|nr:hypothetical protein [Pediococcus stilesii]TLQ03848.1 hypothetical protein FEZ51_07495 [Pediococcus stilesii]
MWKKIIGISLTICSILVIGIIFYRGHDASRYQKMVDKPSDVKKWQADPRPLQTKADTLNQLKKVVKDQGGKTLINKKNRHQIKTTVIPGLRGAWSINFKTKKAAFGTDWVPQGITQSDQSYFVSVYDGEKKLNSLIFQIDKSSRKYIKTLILPTKAHLGGITYDQDHQQLIYSDDTHGNAGFGYLSQKQIDSYTASEAKAPIAAKHIDWSLGVRTSAITVYNHQMVVAKYGRNANERSIITLPLNKKGLPDPISRKESAEIFKKTSENDFKGLVQYLIKHHIINSYDKGRNRLQGVSVSDSEMAAFSQSNGDSPSKIWFQVGENSGWSNLKFAATEGDSIITVPHSAEGVSLSPDDKSLSIIFESGAKKYREGGSFTKRPTFMDRIVDIPINIKVEYK